MLAQETRHSKEQPIMILITSSTVHPPPHRRSQDLSNPRSYANANRMHLAGSVMGPINVRGS